MSLLDADSMHRLAKLALDAGEATSPEHAIEIFSRYRLCIYAGEGWADTLAGQACLLTAVNTAVRAFLGGVTVVGMFDVVMNVPLYEGRLAAHVIDELGGAVAELPPAGCPVLVIGKPPAYAVSHFCVRLTWDGWCAQVAPLNEPGLLCAADNPLAGVAAAALGVNEAFLDIRGESPEVGHRSVGISLWDPLAVSAQLGGAVCGPMLEFLPTSLWLVGLGHLGQAYAWTLGMLPYPHDKRPYLVLQDFDVVGKSNVSTCVLTGVGDVGKRKTRLLSKRLESAGFTTDIVERRFGPDHRLMPGEPTTALVGVDSVNARRDLDTAGFAVVVEGGLGSGYRDFRNMRIHTLPGSRKASQIWTADSASQSAVALNDAYAKLASERNDICGMTQLAARAVATPFVGCLAAALVLAEVVRPLHGGRSHESLDLRMKDLRFRAGALLQSAGYSTPFARLEERERPH